MKFFEVIRRDHRRGVSIRALASGMGLIGAGQQYRIRLDRESIISLYRAAAAADGWHADGENSTPVPSAGLVISAAVACFHKEIDGVGGTTAYLSVNFPSDLTLPGMIEEPNDLYGIELTVSHAGDAGC
ncbi:hypothetical protein [Paractinoplanes rishiriensis]|uniref:Uncharacterized protein n=1 Tax=Paractinoplanes rishiriensis TaxID=1050105 RepID=A0A919N2N9_9ACTN|nr:hypothetical protein [Actinoplanes rishiriensis]GIF01123.1 hypothetical protein Ari01nite_85870 [Actinoplanes rishiriensis]